MGPAAPEAAAGRGRWTGVGGLLVVFLGSLVVAAVLAPYALRAARVLAEVWPSRLWTYLAAKELPRYFDRIRWLTVLGTLPWLARAVGIRSVAALGLAGFRERRRALLVWFGVGVGTVALLGAAQVATEAVALRDPVGGIRMLEVVLLSLISAGLIGLLEEIVFRGVVLRAFLRAFASVGYSVALAALFFAWVHFQRVPSDSWTHRMYPGVGDGLRVAAGTLWPDMADWRPGLFLGLFLAGVVLCLLVVRDASLWPAVGLHAGWVSGALVYRRLVALPVEGPFPPAVLGSRDLVDGAPAWLLLGALAAWLARTLRGSVGAPDPGRSDSSLRKR